MDSRKEQYLEHEIFFGIPNFISASGFFSEKDFEIILNRVKQKGLGIYGIETAKNNDFYGVLVYESFTDNPTDPDWYCNAFEMCKEEGEEILYSATFYVPKNLLH